MKKNHLYIVNKENMVLGPITRMGLWHRFPKANMQRLYLQTAVKLFLLGTVIYTAKKLGMF